LRETVIGLDPRNVEEIHDRVWKRLNPRAYTGVISNALSALDITCWDIAGKAAGRSVAQLLGGHSDHADAYVTFGNLHYDRDQLVECATLFARDGVTKLKMEAACNGGWQEDARRIRAVRDAIGPDVELMIDANYKMTMAEARSLARAVADCNLSWFEEPLHQNDAVALADLRHHINMPVAAGQMEGSRWRFREFMMHKSVDIVQPNCIYCGGFTEQRKVAHMAQAFNLPIANGGGWPTLNLHTMAGLMNGTMVELHLGTTHMEAVAFKDAPTATDNVMAVPDKPGLGFEPDWDALKDTQVKQ
ncbi:MAG: mandelate racemase/muconate lactonizing enzyme family protein, partial [Alphaproteobacteria bacterium]|nr:mandelate racemase/muconate lactonizing enzyme family protein [Alphaproteobacteria bacterium]